MKEIHDFLDKYIQDWGEQGIVNFNFDTLTELLTEFQKQNAWMFDTEKMAEVMHEQLIETQAKQRLDAFIKHEKEQRLFIAANSAMNGLLSLERQPHKLDISRRSLEYADALLAELESSTNQTPQP